MADSIKYNDILINFIPNPQYQQSLASREDKTSVEVIEVSTHQILKVEIFKSLVTHATDVRIEFQDLDNTTASTLSAGKYIVQLAISPSTDGESSTNSAINYFLVDTFKLKENTRVVGYYPTTACIVSLKSVFRTRMDIENNLSFELGGKGNHNIAGSGSAPIQFLETEMSPKITQTYSPDSVISPLSADDFFDLTLTSTDPSVLVTSGPDSGYKMEVDTNTKVLEFFFKHYPLFTTPYGWLVDDFNTDFTKTQPSIIRIQDYLRYDSWRANFDPAFSELLSGSKKQPPFGIPTFEQANAEANNPIANQGITPIINAQTTQAIYNNPRNPIQHLISNTATDVEKGRQLSILDFSITGDVDYYNTSKFLFRDNEPLIYAQSIFDNQPISTDVWNRVHNQAHVLTVNKTEIKVKTTSNPMYSQYLTFLTANEIIRTQKFKLLFFNLHPELIEYTLNNLWVGEIDIHKTVYLPKESQTELANYGLDRYGMGYQVKHTYELKKISTPIHERNVKDLNGNAFSSLPPKHTLTTKINLLYVDAGPIRIEDYEKLIDASPQKNQSFNAFELNDFNNVLRCSSESSVNLGENPLVEPGTPGNGSVAAAGKALIDHGFVYLWGGDRANAMDCSAFTMYAVRNAGADSGRKTRYPNGTSNQLTWLSNKANASMVVPDASQIQAGDIVFFKTSRGDHGHTAIAKSSTEYYHSNSVNKKGADIGTFDRRKPSYIFRMMPLETQY